MSQDWMDKYFPPRKPGEKTEEEVKKELQEQGATSWSGPLRTEGEKVGVNVPLPGMGTIPLTKDYLGRLANAVNIGAAIAPGASPLGQAARIGLGGAGMLLPPSDQPMMDIAAGLAAPKAYDFFSQLRQGPRLLQFGERVGGPALATGMAAWGGSLVDRGADFSEETPWGRIGIYTGISAGADLAHEAVRFLFSPSALKEMQQEVFRQTGHKIPLTLSEKTGSFERIEDFFLRGTKTAKNLGRRQSNELISGFEKLIGFERGPGMAERISEAVYATHGLMRKEVSEFATAEHAAMKAARAAKTGKAAPEDDFEDLVHQILQTDYGRRVGREKIEQEFLDWQVYADARGLTRGERNSTFLFIHRDPAGAGTMLLPRNPTDYRKLDVIRALAKTLPEEKFHEIASSMIMQLAHNRGVFERGVAHGPALQKTLEAYGEFLTQAFGPEKAGTLRKIAQAMTDLDPAAKVLQGGTPETARTGSYLWHKLAFSAFVGGTAGTERGLETGNVLQGLAAGAVGFTVTFGLAKLIEKGLATQWVGDLLVSLSRGNPQAGLNLYRAFTSSGRRPEEPQSTLRSRLGFLFSR